MRGPWAIGGICLVVLTLAACSTGASGSPGTGGDIPASPLTTAAPTGAQTNTPVARALANAIAADRFSAHLELEQSATVTTFDGSTSPPATVAMSGDWSGDDCSFHLTSQDPDGEPEEADVIDIGGTQYLREPGGEWKMTPGMASGADMVRTLLPLDDATVLGDLGIEVVDGRQLHHIAPTTMPAYNATSDLPGVFEAYDIWVEADGTPVVARISYRVGGDGGSVYRGTITLHLTNVGAAVEIKAPTLKTWTIPPVADWLVRREPGFQVNHPPDWVCTTTTEEPGVECVSPGNYPFLKVASGPSDNHFTLAEIATNRADSNEDSRVTSGVVAKEAAAVIRYHFTGPSGWRYYTVRAVANHSGSLYEITLFSLAGRESDSDALFEQFLTSFRWSG